MSDKTKFSLWIFCALIFIIIIALLYFVSGADNKIEINQWIWQKLFELLF